MKNFFDCKDEKITEKAFSQSLIISVLSILLCIVVLCSMTYAWFNGEIKSSGNTITSGCFDIKVDIANANDGVSTASEKVVFADGKYRLIEKGVYTVSLEPSENATVKGYCIVTIDNNVYKTNVILDEDMVDEIYTKKTAPLTFKIVTEKADTIVTFEPHWGVVDKPDIPEKANITVGESQIKIKYDNVTK